MKQFTNNLSFLFTTVLLLTVNGQETEDVTSIKTYNLTSMFSNRNDTIQIKNDDVNILSLENIEKPHYDVPSDELETVNGTILSAKDNSTKKTVTCKHNLGGMPVELVNGTQLINLLVPNFNVTSKEMPGDCILVLFYANFCTFSSLAAPHFNALSRAFPDIKLAAIDAMKYNLFNTPNGIVGIPTLLLFHNGRPIGKFNDTEYTLELFSRFLTKYTGINPEEKSYVTSADFAGPVSSVPVVETDMFLVLSWLFIFICLVYYFSKSKWWKWIVETIQNTWRESEAQHEHND